MFSKYNKYTVERITKKNNKICKIYLILLYKFGFQVLYD